jgi:ferritin-like protein
LIDTTEGHPVDKELAMPQGSTTFHESEERLSARTRDMHRAIVSLMEELEAIDWYQQRMDATEDGELREILRHNRDEEKEHAAMVLEWSRRRDDGFSAILKTYLFTDGSITALEDVVEGGNGAGARLGMRASIGSLRGGAR